MDEQLDIPVMVERAALAAGQGEQVLAVEVGTIGRRRPIVFDDLGKTTAEEAIVIGERSTAVFGLKMKVSSRVEGISNRRQEAKGHVVWFGLVLFLR
jgi:hypothetical protein